MSADLQWAVLRNNSSFLLKRKEARKVVMTKEPNNLTGLNTFKYSGLANKRVVGVEANGERGVVLTTRRKAGAQKPKTQLRSNTLKSNGRAINKTLAKETAGNFYRADLAKDAQRRASAITRSQRKAAGKTTRKTLRWKSKA